MIARADPVITLIAATAMLLALVFEDNRDCSARCVLCWSQSIECANDDEEGN